MKQDEPSGASHAENRPRLAVVIPLLLVCFGSIVFLLYEQLLKPEFGPPPQQTKTTRPTHSTVRNQALETVRPRAFANSDKATLPAITTQGKAPTLDSALNVAGRTLSAPARVSAEKLEGSLAGHHAIDQAEITVEKGEIRTNDFVLEVSSN